jgi:hypothetical protein
MLTLQQFSSYSAGAKYDLVIDLGTYQYSIRNKKQWIQVYQLYDFMVTIVKPVTKKSPPSINIMPVKSTHLNFAGNCFYFN